MRGDYYESFNVNSKNYMDTSKGTDAFMVEFERLIDKCIRASAKGRSSTVPEAFELLFALLRRLDRDPDSVVFFADGGFMAGRCRLAACLGGILPVPR